ncbi:cobalt/nickel transport protein [Anaerosporobacter mobilis DSM 15930]|uniref:Cobalt transport protein CbiN n=1 Tax=Anaerosporobacter mobilis DSM 15930 TaxID=1120996 RepID=A0A1M7G487_9FIRM|nr:cobalt/nickel transport protein [Anaerosporobacter mobilis DSM 15930]
MKLSKKKLIIILLVLCVLIATVPLLMNRESEFGGADGQAEDLISEINPDYEAWADPVMEPPGGETESLLFCLQAALGAGVFGYGLGVLRERSRKESKSA